MSLKYNLSANPNALPQQVRFAKCASISVEFLMLSTDELSGITRGQARKKNHAVFKIDFTDSVTVNHERFRGMRLAMDPDKSNPGPAATFHPGKLEVKLVKYESISHSAARFCTLQWGANGFCKVQSIIDALLLVGMERFSFLIKDKFYQGCRDFVTQAVYLMEKLRYITPEIMLSVPSSAPLPTPIIYDALAMRHAPGGASRSHPIDRGHFKEHNRVEDKRMLYVRK